MAGKTFKLDQYPKHWSKVIDKDEQIHRNVIATEQLHSYPDNNPDLNTLYNILKYSAEKYGDKNALGGRDVLKTIVEEKEITKTNSEGQEIKETKKWNYYKLSPYKWMSYREALEFAHNFGSGLRHLGLKEGSRVLICAPTSKEWLTTALACASQSMQVVTAYDTLGEEGVKHAILAANVSTIFLHTDKLALVARIAKDDDVKKLLKNVIFYGAKSNDELTESKKKDISQLNELDISVFRRDEVENDGKQRPVEPVPSPPNDTGLIMFTSGSTGEPKGVMISHRNLAAVVAGISGLVTSYINLTDTEVILAYLPLAHILEFAIEVTCIYLGISLGYGSRQTLTNDNVRDCVGDVQELRPTIMVGVPQVWDTIRSSVLHTVQEKGRLMSGIFGTAVFLKSILANSHLPTFPIDFLFKRVRDQLGGRLKFIITGGAPISKETQRFLDLTLCPVIQGYGMTETSGLISAQMPGDNSLDTVGAPVPSIEIKLVDVEELGYFSKNNQGEVWVRGATVFQNYLNNEEETKKTLTDDGWLKTGDVGQWLPDGKLRLIDRIKNLVKLSQGEYVALEKIESVYKTSLYVGNICVVANSYMKQPAGIIFPNVKAAASWAKKNGVKFTGLADLINSSSGYKKQILADINDIAKKNGFAKFEQLQDVILDEEEWTPDNGLLTAANKLKRRAIEAKHKDAISQLQKTG
ncbi:long-chain fatty acid-CoA ligase [Mycoemilia scoparia]|uniref:Long-chain fatty acid-CoA ligase n=1 Tax=Mycoemilia scoparia TaxID=417184 RepID=A0A9W8DKE8_9FUNG|nr:long-chain fatty acid-CoA ligase [Mycoemilia scoparia]